MNIRTGDTIISTDGRDFQVEEIDDTEIKARCANPPQRLKTFNTDDLECIDPDVGIWQEMYS